MKKVYKIVMLEDFCGLKKGEETTKYSRDNSASLVQQGKAKYYKEKTKPSKSKK